MATFDGEDFTFASFSPYGYAEVWDRFWTKVLKELDNRAAGLGGAIPAFIATWDAGTADADPGAGKLRINAATAAAATQLFTSATDSLGNDVSAVIAQFGASSSSTRGLLRIGHRVNQAKWAVYAVGGAATVSGAYRKVPLVYLAGPGGFAAGDPVSVAVARTGDKGDKGDTGDTGNNKVCEGGVAGGTANAPTVTASPPFSGARGEMLVFMTGNAANTGAVIITANGVAMTARKNGGAMTGTELPANTRVALISTGTVLELISGGGSSFPDQTGNANKFLKSDGTSASWGSISEAAILPTTSVTGTALNMAVNSSYIANNAAMVTLTLPSVSAVGDLLEVLYFGAGGWRISQNAGQSIIWGPSTTTAGVTDGLKSAGTGATVRLKCVQANTVWEVIAWAGPVTTVRATTQAFDPARRGGVTVLSNGNLTVGMSSTGQGSALGFAIPASGKYYLEFQVNQIGQGGAGWEQGWGITSDTANLTNWPWNRAGAFFYHNSNSGSRLYTGASSTTYGSALTPTQVAGIAIDRDNGWLFFAVQGVWQGGSNPATGANPACSFSGPTYYLGAGFWDNTTSQMSLTYRPAQTQWSFTPPNGYTNLP